MTRHKSHVLRQCSSRAFADGELASLMAVCPKGVEHVLAGELKELGASEVVESVAAVYFEATQAQALHICLWTRVASRIVLLLARDYARSTEEMAAQLGALPWSDWFKPGQKFAVDFNGSNAFIRSSKYGALLCKDSICDQFRDAGETRPVVDVQQPDVLVYARLFKNRYAIGFDLVGESLHRRGYRQAGGAAPLKENLAATLLRLAGWPKIAAEGGAFVDPMCGSGTLLAEAAMMALEIAPAAGRDNWLLENLRGHDSAGWLKQKASADASLDDIESRQLAVAGFDASPSAVATANENLAALGLEAIVPVRQIAIADLRDQAVGEKGLVLTNPPYGRRLGEEGRLEPLYKALGSWLASYCQGWEAAIFTGNPELGWATGLRSYKKHRLYNGAIPCELQRFRITPESIRRASEKTVRAEVVTLDAGGEMLLNRLRKNRRRLEKKLQQNGVSCYRLYDADLPEYAVAIDVYRGWPVASDDVAQGDVNLPGGEASWYLHVQEYAPPESIDASKANQRLSMVRQALSQLFDVDGSAISTKQRRRQRGSDQYEKRDGEFSDIVIEEGGHRFIVNLGRYLDTGIFLDHRGVRQYIASLARGARFLNLFAYTATATVYAAKAGARSSVSVDMSKTYQRWARRNFRLNGLSLAQHQLVCADCLAWLAEHDRQYDLILLDPPSFSNSSRMQRTLDIQRDHAELLDQSMKLLAPGGSLVFSTNRRGFRLDEEPGERYRCESIDGQTYSPDFGKAGSAHRCWRLQAVGVS